MFIFLPAPARGFHSFSLVVRKIDLQILPDEITIPFYRIHLDNKKWSAFVITEKLRFPISSSLESGCAWRSTFYLLHECPFSEENLIFKSLIKSNKKWKFWFFYHLEIFGFEIVAT